MLKLKVVKEKEPITNEWSVEKVASEYPPPSWEELFENAKLEIKDVSDILEEDRINGRRLPDNCNLFRAFMVTPLHKVRVVLLAQDPYHTILPNGNPQAMGMSFSVPVGAPIPSSLRNIFKELKDTVPNFKTPSHGNLTNWAVQGVLLLNSCLTVRESSPGCHKEIWNGFIKKTINTILNANPDCIFVAWGRNAQKVASKFVGEKATILTAAHPSGLSANRGFFKCDHFNQINELLVKQKSEPIDWNL